MHLRDLRLNMRVVVQGNKHGVCRYLGRTKFARDEWVGVELDQPSGKHDGVVEGIRYFVCSRPNTGLFVRAADIEQETEEEPVHLGGMGYESPRTLAGGARGQGSRAHTGAVGQHRRAGSNGSTGSFGGGENESPRRHIADQRNSPRAWGGDDGGDGTPRRRSPSPHGSAAGGGVGSTLSPPASAASASPAPAARSSASPRPSSPSSSPPATGHGHAPGHDRNSSDLARVELAALLGRSAYLRHKPQVMADLTSLIARRPSTTDMLRSGILADGAGPGSAPSAAAAAGPQGKSPLGPRLGWAAGSSPESDLPSSQRRMWVWGENSHGELATGDETDLFSPSDHFKLPKQKLPSGGGSKAALAPRTAPADFAQVCLGLHHVAVLTLGNEVLTAGSWVANLLGTDDRTNLKRLKRLRQFEDMRARAPGNPIVSLCCGDRHTVALHSDGSCESFGGTLYGKLGHRSSGGSSNDYLPTGSRANEAYTSISGLRGQKVQQVAAGIWHSACLTVAGSVFTFGGGGKFYNSGQLGLGSYEDSMTPRKIEIWGGAGPSGMPASKVFVKAIVCGGYHSLALTVDRAVYSWGSGKFGQLGLGNDNNHHTPQLVYALLGPHARSGRTVGLAAGENHSLTVQADGSVYAWGYGMQGQLGHGHSGNEKSPRKVSFFSKRNIVVVQVAAGWRHSVALTESHSVYAWGHGDHGQLGLGDTRSHSSPQLVESLEGKEIKTVAAGGSHSLAFNDFFKAAQELVFLQKVREFRAAQSAAQPKAADVSRIPTLRQASRDLTGSNAGPSRSATVEDEVAEEEAGLVRPHDHPGSPLAPNPLVPLGLKALLHDLEHDLGDEAPRSSDFPPEEDAEDEDGEDERDDAEEEQVADQVLEDELPRDALEALNEAFGTQTEDPIDEGVEDEAEAEEDEQPRAPPKQMVDRAAGNDGLGLAREPAFSVSDEEEESKYVDEDDQQRRFVPRPTHTVESTHSSSTHLSSSGDALRIELIYSEHVECTHRFVTFQTATPEAAVRQLVDDYKQTVHGTKDVIFDQLMVTPGNTLSRTRLSETPHPSSRASIRADHVYEYDAGGPPRYTLLLILSSVSSDPSLWPAWASTFYHALHAACGDLTLGLQHSNREIIDLSVDPNALRPCFRELRPPTQRQK